MGSKTERIIAKITKKNLIRNKLSVDVRYSISNNGKEHNQIKSPICFNSNNKISSYLENITKSNTHSYNNDSFANSDLFSMYQKGIKIDEYNNIIPENIAVHIAQRLKCDLLIDALCGVGLTTVQVIIHA